MGQNIDLLVVVASKIMPYLQLRTPDFHMRMSFQQQIVTVVHIL